MGVLQYKSLIVVGDEPKLKELITQCAQYNKRLWTRGEQTVPVTALNAVSNGLCAFAILPTGSKLGWPRHLDAEELMAEIEALARVGRGKRGQWATTARVEWGELPAALYVDGRNAQ